MAVKRRRRKNNEFLRFMRAFFLTLIIIFVLGATAYLVINMLGESKKEEGELKQVTVKTVQVDGIDTTGFSKTELKESLMRRHFWEMKIVYGDQVYDCENALSSLMDDILDEAYSESAKASYMVKFDEDQAQSAAKLIASSFMGNVDLTVSQNEAMVYDSDSNSFIFSDANADRVINKDQLTADVAKALLDENYTAVIEASTIDSDVSFRASDFKKIATYVTHTTNNSNRNTNVKLSCQAVNGTVIPPGAQFSYNETLGKRTAEKGYKEAGAYANGEHVMELGGGVCQLSSTIYNAVIAANLQVDERTGHTYEPTYVTPGEDATVSYAKPDFVFTNNTQAPVGILASFADRTVTVDIYGIPQLEEGVSRHLRSEKIADTEPPAPTYVEDPTVIPGLEDVVKNAKHGSKWATYLVLEKDGEVISEEYLHTTVYKGEPATIRRNLTGLAALGLIPAPADQSTPEQPQEAP